MASNGDFDVDAMLLILHNVQHGSVLKNRASVVLLAAEPASVTLPRQVMGCRIPSASILALSRSMAVKLDMRL